MRSGVQIAARVFRICEAVVRLVFIGWSACKPTVSQTPIRAPDNASTARLARGITQKSGSARTPI